MLGNFRNAWDGPQKAVDTAAHPGICRMTMLSGLGAEAQAALIWASRRAIEHAPRREFFEEGQEIDESYLMLDGWAARLRILADGRRQLFGFYLPGDIIGDPLSPISSRTSTTFSLTTIRLCRLPQPTPTLEIAYARSLARLGDYLLAQIVRVGRMTAYERIADMLVELYNRLEFTNLVTNDGFELPLTQELLADFVGLTPVHTNRTIQQLRRTGAIRWTGKHVTLLDHETLKNSIAGRQ